MPDARRSRNVVVNSRPSDARYKPIISLSKFVIAIPARAGIFEIANIDSHPGAGFSVRAERQPRLDRHILEFSVSQIPVQLVRLRIVRHQQIRPAVVVVIEHRHAQRFRAAVENSARRRHIFKRAVAAIVKQPARVPAIRFRRAIRFVRPIQAAKNIVLRRPAHVVAHKQIQQSVAIVVEPDRRRAERRAALPARWLSCTSTNVPLPVLRNSRFCPTQVIKMSGKPSLL